MQNDNKSKDAN